MSRSHKKQPGGGIAVADSDKWFKTSEHRRERRYVTSSLRRDEEPMPRDFGNPCKSAKDGKTYWVDQRSKVDEEISVGSRGRKSMTDLMIDGSTSVIQRPDAPYDLTDAGADEWRAIVASMPPEHFARIHYPMLTQLCRH